MSVNSKEDSSCANNEISLVSLLQKEIMSNLFQFNQTSYVLNIDLEFNHCETIYKYESKHQEILDESKGFLTKAHKGREKVTHLYI